MAQPSAAPRAPRLLLYVAEPRPSVAPSLPGPLTGPLPGPPPGPPPARALRDSRHQPEPPDPRQPPNTLFYKPLADSDGQVSAFVDSDLVQRTEFFPVNQPFLKETGAKVEDIKVCDRPNGGKRDCGNLGVEFRALETQFRPQVEVEQATYQPRFTGPDIMPPMQSVAIRNPSQFDACAVLSEGTNVGDRDLGKGFVNYQILEQSVSHQSIVNQSISILNQQVGVSRSAESEGAVLLAVLPPPSEDPSPAHPEVQTITVPLGWSRIINGTSVIYVSPSGTALSTLSQLREYLQTSGTCKCGLPCPLRPETAFSFDHKVVSKPYVAPTGPGAELTRLCNHKRKLLATLQRGQSAPALTTPHQAVDGNKVGVGEAGGLVKKKMKKRAFPNMSVSQMMVQRERPIHDFKPQDSELNRTVSPGMVRANSGQTVASYHNVNVNINVNMPPVMADDAKVEAPTRQGGYLTVSSGWISQQEHPEPHKSNQPITNLAAGGCGVPVLGTNGQIIGVNTSYKPNNFKNIQTPITNLVEEKDNRKEPKKEEESQIFCGLNQALTPEVMQKINEQQQIFIQQNQKQIELAMKGYRAQLADTNKPVQSQYVAQGQLVIQNGAVVKTNPAKTPPWQVKRPDAAALVSPSPKPPKVDQMDDDSNTNASEDSSGSYSPFTNNDQAMNAMCSRVPPLPQHYNMLNQQWALDANKKKTKANNKPGRKKNSPTENKVMQFSSQSIRIVQDSKGLEEPSNGVPSFMDDPTGYLAQQTVLLNNTISRQVGMNQTFDTQRYDNSSGCYVAQNQPDKSIKLSAVSGKPCDAINTYNTVANPSPSPNNAPDSSAPLEQSGNMALACCAGCNAAQRRPETLQPRQMRTNNFREREGAVEDSPVTSSTFAEQSPPAANQPIQARIVSTSARSDSHYAKPVELSPPAQQMVAPSSSPVYLQNQMGGQQLLQFIPRHQADRNFVEIEDGIMVRRNSMPGYRPPPHLGGGPAPCVAAGGAGEVGAVGAWVRTAGVVSVTRDTLTCAVAGRCGPRTTAVGGARPPPPPPPPALSPAALAIPADRPDPFVAALRPPAPASYPLHVAGSTAAHLAANFPDMVASVLAPSSEPGAGPRRAPPASPAPPGQILISSTGQIIVSGAGMGPPPPKPGGSGMVVAPLVVPPPVVVEGGAAPHLVLAPQDGKLVQGVMLSPETLKKRTKKRRSPGASSVLQVAPPQVVVGGGSSPFSPRSFQLSPGAPSPPVLQALTLVPGKAGAAPHIVMNNQPSHQLVAGASHQQINLLQPVNLLNNSGVVSNFPAFQQFLVPNLGSVVMATEGGLLGEGVQLQLQPLGTSVVGPPSAHSPVFAPPAPLVLRPSAKLQSGPQPQFLSPAAPVVMNGASFQSQLSPLLNLSPPGVFPQQVRANSQEMVGTSRAGQALVVPVSPKRNSSRANSTIVQNTTIVQHHTTLVASAPPAAPLDALSLEEQVRHSVSTQTLAGKPAPAAPPSGGSPPDTTTHSPLGALEPHCSPGHSAPPHHHHQPHQPHQPHPNPHQPQPQMADTTTRSPEPDANSSAMVQCVSSSEPDVSEPRDWQSNDFANTHHHHHHHHHHQQQQHHQQHHLQHFDQAHDSDTHNMMGNIPQMRQNRTPNSVETTEIHYNQPMSNPAMGNQHMMPISSNYYDRPQAYKRKNDFGDGSTYRTDKIMRSNNGMVHGMPKDAMVHGMPKDAMVHGMPKDNDYDAMAMTQDKCPRLFSSSGSSSDDSMQKIFDRHNLGSDNDSKSSASDGEREGGEGEDRRFAAGDLVWGPMRGHASWPGALVARCGSRWRVRWFGGGGVGSGSGAGSGSGSGSALLPARALLTLSEGLEAHHAARTHHRKSRKLNTQLENAIQEAMAELDKKSEQTGGAETTEGAGSEPASGALSRRPRRPRKGKLHKRTKASSKPADGARLRSSR